MNLAQKHGLDFIMPDAPEGTRDRIDQTKASDFMDPYDKSSICASDMSFLLKELYLLGRYSEALGEIPNFCAAVKEHLVGDWQKTLPIEGAVDPEKWHRGIGWFDDLRDTLMWCSAILDWESIARILIFIDGSVETRKSGEEGRAYYVALRYHFEGKPAECEAILKKIISSKNVKYRQLAECLMAILNEDKPVVSDAWHIVYERWLKKDAKMDWYLAPESTFLYYLAQSFGCQITLSEEQKDCIVHL